MRCVMRVACPLCPKEKFFKRSTLELKKHVASHHPTDLNNLTDKIICRKEWILDGNPPERLVTLSLYQALSSVQVGELIRTWFEKAKISRHRREEWENG